MLNTIRFSGCHSLEWLDEKQMFDLACKKKNHLNESKATSFLELLWEQEGTRFLLVFTV
jgi:hypothetical protein